MQLCSCPYRRRHRRHHRRGGGGSAPVDYAPLRPVGSLPLLPAAAYLERRAAGDSGLRREPQRLRLRARGSGGGGGGVNCAPSTRGGLTAPAALDGLRPHVAADAVAVRGQY
jgi:hypothetical protein